jgi:ferredoxin-NADP reductase
MVSLVEREGRPWQLAYAGRTISSMAFCGELERYGDKVRLHPSRRRGRMDLDHLLGTKGPLAVFCLDPRSGRARPRRHHDDLRITLEDNLGWC